MVRPLGTAKKPFTITLESLMPLILNFNLKKSQLIFHFPHSLATPTLVLLYKSVNFFLPSVSEE